MLAILLMPHLGAWNAAFELLAVLLLLPLVVHAAAATRLEGRGKRLAAWSGALSYSVYALHYPLVGVIGVIGNRLAAEPASRFALALAGIVGLSFSPP